MCCETEPAEPQDDDGDTHIGNQTNILQGLLYSQQSKATDAVLRVPPSPFEDDSPLFRVNSHYRDTLLDAEDIKKDYPILYEFVSVCINAAKCCRENNVPVDEQFSGIYWKEAEMDYLETPQGKIIWHKTTQDPSLSFFDWHANYQLIVDRIDNGFVSYEHMIQSRLPGQMATDAVIQRIISSQDIGAIAMIETILDERYQKKPPTRNDFRSADVGKNDVDRAVKNYPELFGNYKTDKVDKMSGSGYFLKAPYDKMISGNLETLGKLVRGQMGISTAFADEESNKRMQSFVKSTLGFEDM